MSRVLILIPCSGSKRCGGVPVYNKDKSILNYLSNFYEEKLIDLRRQLFGSFNLEYGLDLRHPEVDKIEYMEAFRRYSGNISQQISSLSWQKLQKTEELDLIFVSALYGLLKYDENIRYYNVMMKDKMGINLLKSWWKKNNLIEVLKDYLDKNKISEVHNVLSNDYKKALDLSLNNFNVKFIYHDFSIHKSGSNFYRGKWVDNFILSF